MENSRTVAKKIKSRLDEKRAAFITIEYNELLSMYREATGYEARLSATARERLTDALSQEGIQVFPSLDDRDGSSVRFFRAGTILWDIVSNLRYPGAGSDTTLAGLISKIKANPSILEISITQR